MKVIRHEAFETNSSSCHSISIASSGGLLDSLPVADGRVSVNGGEFGWEPDTFRDAETKASYAYTYASTTVGEGEEREAHLRMLREVILEQTGADSVVFGAEAPSRWHDSGYIDHQSADVCAEAFESKDSLR